MRNWSVDTSRLKKNPKKYSIWKLEQQLNFGLAKNEKINKKTLKKYLPVLNIDSDTRNFIEYILYGKKPSYSAAKKLS